MNTLLINSFLTAVVIATPITREPLKFEKTRIGNVTYEAASVFDVDKDGNLDIVSGECWFPGPDFKARHKICTLRREKDWYDDFSDYPLDVDGDGYLDIITGGWWGQTLRWRQNPKGKPIPWQTHDIDKCGNIETIRFWDVDTDGQLEIVPNLPGHPLIIYKLLTDNHGKPAAKFSKHIIYKKPQGHGLGFGDINGDGRGDFVLRHGWLEAPRNPLNENWAFHPEFNLGSAASIPILVHDVNGDTKADLIAGQAHDYGLSWWQQKIDPSGKRTWLKHDIDPNRSQYHELTLADIDNDGQVELITGKRYYAHCGKDPGAEDPIGLYCFEINANKFKRITIDYGPPSQASGAGIYLWVTDITGNVYKDILAPGKEGLYLFKNLGPTLSEN